MEHSFVEIFSLQKGADAVKELEIFKKENTHITIHDPWADQDEVMHEYGLKSLKLLPNEKFDAVVLTVSHNIFKEIDFLSLKNENAIIYDIKNFLDNNDFDVREHLKVKKG